MKRFLMAFAPLAVIAAAAVSVASGTPSPGCPRRSLMAGKLAGLAVLVTALVAAVALGVTAGSARAVPIPPCVVIDDGGHCAPLGLMSPDYGAVTNTGSWDAADGRHCYNGHDYWIRGGSGYDRDLHAYASWCANAGQSQIVSFSVSFLTQTSTFCHLSSAVESPTYSGGIGSSWITKLYSAHFSCATPWPGGYNDTVQFKVRYGTHGLHYFP